MYKILVVDDEPKIREVIKEYAEFSGYEVTEAADGMSAVGLCKLNDYDLIIMDIMMPKLDGFSACKEIKKTKDIPGVRHLCSPKRSSLTLQPIGKWAFFMKLFVKFEYFLCCNCCIFILSVI